MARRRIQGYFQYTSVGAANAARDWLTTTWAPAHDAAGSAQRVALNPNTGEGCAANSQVQLTYVYLDNSLDNGPLVEIHTAIGEGGTVATSSCASSLGDTWISD